MNLKEIQKKAKQNAISKIQNLIEKPEDLENIPNFIDATKDLSMRVHNVLFIQTLEHVQVLNQISKAAKKNAEKAQNLKKEYVRQF